MAQRILSPLRLPFRHIGIVLNTCDLRIEIGSAPLIHCHYVDISTAENA